MQGPIDRADNLLPQMDEVHTFDYEGYNHGLAMILFGAFKKVVIANRLAVLVDTVYGKVGGYSGQAYWVAAVFFAFQIYCDFSGYTDMALGSAELMGFRLPVNFSKDRSSRLQSRISGDGGISLFRTGSGIICTFRSGAAMSPKRGGPST